MTVKHVGIIGIIFGLTLVIGTRRGWKFLTDPPENYCLWYSHSFLNKVFGKTVLKYFNYITGIGLIVLGMYFLVFES